VRKLSVFKSYYKITNNRKREIKKAVTTAFILRLCGAQAQSLCNQLNDVLYNEVNLE
jgi:hypothetical protein